MAYYPQFPAMYAYPMPIPNQEFYAMYPPGSGAPPGRVFYEHPHHQYHQGGQRPVKQGFANRKDSADSGISDFSSFSSRKSSSISTVSSTSVGVLEDHSSLDDIKEETIFEEPDDDLCEQIVQQVEFYFSDANISKDKFLLKHVKRNKEGFVSLKLVSSFKRVKHLSKDWRQVAYAVENKSDKLEVNDEKTKVRRLANLPEYDETTPSRTVVALNLPLERPTIEAVAEIFSACGDIVLIRILRPGNPIPADIKPFVNKHPEMTDKVCALIEYERTEFAHKAVKDLDCEEEDRMKVMELTAPPPKTTKNKDAAQKKLMMRPGYQAAPGQLQQAAQQRRFSHAGFHLPSHHQQHPGQQFGQQDLAPRRRISLNHNMKFSAMSEEQMKKEQQLNPNAPTFQMAQRRLSRPTFIHPAAAIEAAAAVAAANVNMQMQMAASGPSPWMMRRISAGGLDAFSASGLTLPPNVVRMPRGPEKGKGFQKWCRNRMTTDAPAKKGSHAVPIVPPPAEEKVSANKPKAEEEFAAPAAPEGAAAKAVPVAEAAAAPAVDAAVAKAEAAPAVDDAVAEEVQAAAAAAPQVAVAVVADSCSDSGNEDDSSISDQDLHLAAAEENERSR